MGRPTCSGGKRPACPARKSAGRSVETVIKSGEKWWSKQAYFLHKIPKIMDSEGWKQGATFQRLWFSLPAQRRTDQNVRSLYVDNTTIEMQWVLTFERAKKVYDRLVRSAATGSLWHKPTLKKRILAASKQMSPSVTTISFPPGEHPLKELKRWELHDWAVASEGVRGIEYDGLLAALGEFEFYVVPVGTAEGSPHMGYTANIEKVGIYVHDSFDFNDNHRATTDAADTITCQDRMTKVWGLFRGRACSQPLGVWDFKKGKLLRHKGGVFENRTAIYWYYGYSAGDFPERAKVDERIRKELNLPATTNVGGEGSEDDFIYVGNATYRNYRKTTGKGGDFMIFSDVKEEAISKQARGRTIEV